MAILTAQVNNTSRIFDLPADVLPAKGTFVATCIDIKDMFGVERRKFQSEETETVDLTGFLFGYRDKQGNTHKIASKGMKISGNEKSALYLFLKSWLGQAPKMGWDYMELKGSKALLTIDHETRKSGEGQYATIVSISPLPDGMEQGTAPAPAPEKASKAKAAPAPVVVEEEDDDEVPF